MCTVALLAMLACAGCTYTVAGDEPAAMIEAVAPAHPPIVEHTVSEFSFALGGGDMAPAIFDGRQLSNEIMTAWQKRGYVQTQSYVPDGAFSGAADYHLTLRGSQRGETSWTMQIINVLTLSLVPYRITQRYDFDCELQDTRNGATYNATVKASDTTWVEPLLIFALPFASRGHLTTMQRVGDALFAQFQRQGAFAPTRVSVGASHPAGGERNTPGCFSDNGLLVSH